jgi:DNA/RNA-binding domain of Phe-tRNA-synthetase-like protein
MTYELKVDPVIFERFPTYRAMLIYAKNVQNAPSYEYSIGILRAAEAEARKAFGDEKASGHPHIAAWRETFKAFGAKPSKYPCSAEALLSRVLKGNDLGGINKIVDVYNAVSIKYVMPVGGEDWDKLTSDLILKPATGSEPFVIMQEGAEATTYPEPGEIVWTDSTGVTCRMWNWRQCRRTQLTEATTSAYFVLDTIGDYAPEKLDAAGSELIGYLREIAPDAEITSQIVAK